MKKIIVLTITFLIIILIYFVFCNRNYNYVLLYDNNMNSNEIKKIYQEINNNLKSKNIDKINYNEFYASSILSLYDSIHSNKTIWINNKELFIKKVLRESDLVIISIGMEELIDNYTDSFSNNYIFVNKMYHNIELLVHEIKKYAKNKIVFIGYNDLFKNNNSDYLIKNVNDKLNTFMYSNNIYFINAADIYDKKNNIVVDKILNIISI